MADELDGLTAIDRLRLYAIDPDTFSFDIDDAEDAVAKYDELAARADLVEPLVEALRQVRSIISDGAATGFNCHDGDWAERLFKSQAATFAALQAYEVAQ